MGDGDVGRYFALKLGVTHHRHRPTLDADRMIANIHGTVRATGGEADVAVAQDAMLGQEFYRGLATQYAYLLRGDEVWGWGDRVLTRDIPKESHEVEAWMREVWKRPARKKR